MFNETEPWNPSKLRKQTIRFKSSSIDYGRPNSYRIHRRTFRIEVFALAFCATTSTRSFWVLNIIMIVLLLALQ